MWQLFLYRWYIGGIDCLGRDYRVGIEEGQDQTLMNPTLKSLIEEYDPDKVQEGIME